jgi:N,N-dimethylformamidase
LAWAFEGIPGETLGAHGYLLGGAAGDELDHADPARGTPESTVILMSSRHNDLFFPSLDSVTEVAPNQQGSKNPHVRAEVVLVDHFGGGRVFSTGSICWAGSLGTNNYDNDIAQLTTNVLRKFPVSEVPGDNNFIPALNRRNYRWPSLAVRRRWPCRPSWALFLSKARRDLSDSLHAL